MSSDQMDEEIINDSKLLLRNRRLLAISSSLARMKEKNKHFLENFELTNDYRLFRTALLGLNFQRKLNDIIEFKTCDNIDEEKSYFFNSERKFIMCSNKVNDQEEFNKLMKYNMVLLYDELRAKIDWTDCSQIACMQIRALNISSYCKREDKSCFSEKLKKSFNKFELCKHKDQESMEKVYKQCIKDVSPISKAHMNKSGYIF